MGSTGTGVLAGVAAGATTGILCDKLTGGNNTGACVAAGMAVGAAVGTWAASLDEAAEKAVPAMDCASIKRRMNYPSTASKPKALLKFSEQLAQVVKPGEALKIPLKMDLATPGADGKEQEITIKFENTFGTEKSTGRPITKPCGGDFTLPFVQETTTEGVYNSTIQLINAADNSKIEGGLISFCYTVANDGINKCGMTTTKTVSGKKQKGGK